MVRGWSLASIAIMMAATAGVIVMTALLTTCAPPSSTVPILLSHRDSETARSAASMSLSGLKARARSRQLAAKSPASVVAEDVNLPRQNHEKSPTSASAEDLNLPRQKLELVSPPFVHPHEQVATGGPKIYEVRLV